MKPIVARDQVRLGYARCLQLALSGMSYRMFRSGVTVAILALAAAFLVHMLSFGLLEHEIEVRAYGELQGERRLGQDVMRLGAPDSSTAIQRALADGDAPRLAEYARWAGAPPAKVAEAGQVARRLADAERYFAELPAAAHAVVVGDLTAQELFDRLARRDAFEAFAQRAPQLGMRPPPGGFDALRRTIQEERPALLELVAAIEGGQRAAITRVQQSYPGRSPGELLSNPPLGLAEALRAAGFEVDANRVDALSHFARNAEDRRTVDRLLLGSETCAAVARATGLEIGKVSFDALAGSIDEPSHARWLADLLRAAGAPPHLGAERLAELGQRHQRDRKLADAVGDQVPVAAGALGLPGRSQWLIALSFLVCVVGVANAMLMSVTERFTEIATMKCLGAMDRFVMLMFVFEAVIQGAVGGVIGLVLGLLLAIARTAVDYGSLLADAGGAVGSVAWAMLGSLFAGIALAALAAVGPSWVAARLAPMEAMRVE
jgi:hypothetical protein